MSAPRTGTPFVFVSLATAALLSAAAVGCTRQDAGSPPSSVVTAGDAAADTASAPNPAPRPH